MSVTEDLADALARDTLEAMARSGDETLPTEVARLIGASSQTLEEAYLSAVRVRLAARRAQAFLDGKRGR